MMIGVIIYEKHCPKFMSLMPANSDAVLRCWLADDFQST